LKNTFSISDINLKNRTQYIDIESRHSNLDYNRSKAYCPAKVSFSSCQRDLIKAFQIEAVIALITKMAIIFS